MLRKIKNFIIATVIIALLFAEACFTIGSANAETDTNVVGTYANKSSTFFKGLLGMEDEAEEEIIAEPKKEEISEELHASTSNDVEITIMDEDEIEGEIEKLANEALALLQGGLSFTKVEEEVDVVVKEVIEVKLLYVIDGDTIKVSLEGEEVSVRLIGIDTPESVHSDESKNTQYGTYASDYTKTLLSDVNTVWLQFDEEMFDVYERVLAYVWLTDYADVTNVANIKTNMVNAIVLDAGYAINKEYQPNVMYAEVFESIRQEAENNKVGLWGTEAWTN